MNLPNKLTLARVCAIPVFLFFMLMPESVMPVMTSRIISLVIFIAAALTDTLDGYIARSRNLVTDFGKFMDPLADKLLVISAMICFVERNTVPAYIIIIIVAREFAISGFRLVAAEKKVVIAASMWGKVKTVVQMVFCGFFIVDLDVAAINVIEQILMYAALVLTIVSLIDYFVKNKHIIAEATK